MLNKTVSGGEKRRDKQSLTFGDCFKIKKQIVTFKPFDTLQNCGVWRRKAARQANLSDNFSFQYNCNF